MIPEFHTTDPSSQALIFPRTAVTQVLEDNTVLQAKLDAQGALLAALMAALPKSTLDKIPAGLLEVLSNGT